MNAKYDYEKKLVAEVTIPEYFNSYVLPLKKGLNELSKGHTVSVCPFHNESDPSFHYFPNSESFCCFGRCNISSGKKTAGNIIDLHILTQKAYKNRLITRRTAYIEICQLYGKQELLKDLSDVASKGAIYKREGAERTGGFFSRDETNIAQHPTANPERSTELCRQASDIGSLPDTHGQNRASQSDTKATQKLEYSFTCRNLLQYKREQAQVIRAMQQGVKAIDDAITDGRMKSSAKVQRKKDDILFAELKKLVMLDIDMSLQIKNDKENR